MKKQEPIEQFVKIIGEETFHIFHAEYLLFGRSLSIEEFIIKHKKRSILRAFFWIESFNGDNFYRKLSNKIEKEWRD